MTFLKATNVIKLPAGTSQVELGESVLWGLFASAAGDVVITRRKEKSDNTLVNEPSPQTIAVTANTTVTLENPIFEHKLTVNNQTGNVVLLLLGNTKNSIRGGSG